MPKIFLHGSGHKAASWNETISYMEHGDDILCPNLSAILNGKEADYPNLRASFAEYCSRIDEQIHLCGISLGGILALSYALDHPEKVKTLVLIGTPHKVPKAAFGLQNVMFRFLPESVFENMAFGKKDTFILGNSMKNLDFSNKLRDVQCPALIVCGKKDRANIKSAYYLSNNIKNAELRIIEKTGHVVNEEAPKALADLLDGFYGTEA